MGRRPDPLPLKILKGRSATKDIAGRPIPQAPAFNRGAPDPPGWLNPEAREEWNRIAPELDRLELIKPEDAGILVAYCLAWSRLVSAEAIIQTAGLAATNPQTAGALCIRRCMSCRPLAVICCGSDRTSV